MENLYTNLDSFRPCAVPLITVDPYFSIWSFEDKLYSDYTRHWSGRANPMFAGVIINDCFYSVMGHPFSKPLVKSRTLRHLEQKSLNITPLRTEYIFENEALELTLSFLSPLILNRFDIMSRPVSYMEYNIKRKTDEDIKLKFVFGISAQCCVDVPGQKVRFGKTSVSTYMGNDKQNILSKTGDDVCIDWGYLHISEPDAKLVNMIDVSHKYKLGFNELDFSKAYNAYADNPVLLVEKDDEKGFLALAYDEINPIEYLGDRLNEYYTEYFASFGEMFVSSVKEYEAIKETAFKYEEKLLNDFKPFGKKYTDICSLAFRQAVAAHKLVKDKDGNLLFLSKECHSNGCIGTMDITYPSMPLFLKYNPSLVLGMLRPIVKYAKGDSWKYDFAPHDLGQYPKANGQVYTDLGEEFHMPVEECGNALITLAAIKRAGFGDDFIDENKDIFKLWADYLVKYGYMPENQLCTDDFSGHIKNNCNLSLKAIIGIAAYSYLYNDNSYMDIAKKMAKDWEKDASNDLATRLSFDVKDSWSLKYNIIWDKIFGFGLFSEETYEKEIKLYSNNMNRYGVPLGYSYSYSKLDWMFWTTVMTDNKDYFEKIVDAAYLRICETCDRAPMGDWYDTVDSLEYCFRNRSVVGGIFINLI